MAKLKLNGEVRVPHQEHLQGRLQVPRLAETPKGLPSELLGADLKEVGGRMPGFLMTLTLLPLRRPQNLQLKGAASPRVD